MDSFTVLAKFTWSSICLQRMWRGGRLTFWSMMYRKLKIEFSLNLITIHTPRYLEETFVPVSPSTYLLINRVHFSVKDEFFSVSPQGHGYTNATLCIITYYLESQDPKPASYTTVAPPGGTLSEFKCCFSALLLLLKDHPLSPCCLTEVMMLRGKKKIQFTWSCYGPL